MLAKGLDIDAVTAGDLMGEPLTTVFDSEGIEDAIWRMRGHGIRRLPVVDAHGLLLGVVTMHDIAARLAADLGRHGAHRPGTGPARTTSVGAERGLDRSVGRQPLRFSRARAAPA